MKQRPKNIQKLAKIQSTEVLNAIEVMVIKMYLDKFSYRHMSHWKKKTRVIVFGCFFVASVIGIVLLTIQSPEGTIKLSEFVRTFIEKFGIESSSHSVRSNAHLVEYFFLGMFLALFGKELAWKDTSVFFMGSVMGLSDECLKILLPTREFDYIDWLKDCIGVVAAIIFVRVLHKIKTLKKER